MKHEILLFDLIGVLVTDSNRTTQALLKSAGVSMKEFVQYWISSPTMKNFDLGITSSQEFSENVVRDLKLSMNESEFLELFRNWVGGLFDGTDALLRMLAQRYRLGCFSNINEIMWPQIRDQFGLGTLLNYHFLSYEMGKRKPDIVAFTTVLQQLDTEPNRIVFFDDLEENVISARKVGMNAFVTKGLADVREQLNLLGML